MAPPVAVLLVEDSAAERQLVCDALAFARKPGFAVGQAARLSDALKALEGQRVDVVVLDLGLPDAAGLEGLAAIQDAAPSVPIVVRSGLSDERMAVAALGAGAQDYVIKGRPDRDEGLERSIRYALARVQAEDSQRRLAAIVESSDDAIVSKARDGTITSWNPGAERLYGYSAAAAIGQPVAMLVPSEREGEHDEILARVLGGERVDHYETRRLRRDGTLVDVSLTVSPITDAGGRVIGASAIARDITERKQLELELRHYADHDPLTDLLNRRRFEEELERQIALARRGGPGAALLSIDLDGLKAVNDTCGHQAGDELLRRTAAGIRARLRISDVAARLGGDEFAVLLPAANAGQAAGVARDLVAVVQDAAAALGDGSLRASASIGIALLEDTCSGADDVLLEADVAMYEAKQAGGSRFAVARADDPREEEEADVAWLAEI